MAKFKKLQRSHDILAQEVMNLKILLATLVNRNGEALTIHREEIKNLPKMLFSIETLDENTFQLSFKSPKTSLKS